MSAVKKMLFGISLIAFGLWCFYVGVACEWGAFMILGLILPIVGIIYSLAGFVQKGDKRD